MNTTTKTKLITKCESHAFAMYLCEIKLSLLIQKTRINLNNLDSYLITDGTIFASFHPLIDTAKVEIMSAFGTYFRILLCVTCDEIILKLH